MKSSAYGLNAMMLGTNGGKSNRKLMPWSFRFGIGVRLFISLALGFVVSIVGTPVHRMGASSNLPYGLVLALVLVGISAWQARARGGIIGLVLHLIASCFGVGMLAGQGPMGDVLIPVGGAAFNTYFGLHVGYYWLLGLILVQFVIALFPVQWFVVIPRLADDAPILDTEGEIASGLAVSVIGERESAHSDPVPEHKEPNNE
ncbi:alcohol dehydrogenase [Bifidobacterium aquikefiri]|uniref:alcohol dehydrogenase n=1 Tax=Bifidobacterium aquikefiri TaxID=1653207 RepID=UPI0039E89606